MTIQYIIIAIIFAIAVFFMVRKFMPSKDKKAGCGKGCGCSFTDDKKLEA